MELTRLMRLIPTMDMVAETLEARGQTCLRHISDPEQKYRGVLPYTGQPRLEKDLLYLVREEDCTRFPGDAYSCICSRPVAGTGNHLHCPGITWDQLLQQLLELFCEFQDQEARLNSLVFSDSDLQSLCRLGEQLTGNPVCIHDDWFILIASSDSMPGDMTPEQVSGSNRDFVPRHILEDFQFDADYEQTYTQRRCQLWHRTPTSEQCLYVNLQQDFRYLGRLLIFETVHPFRARDYLIAEVLAQRAILILAKQTAGIRQYRNLDDVVCALLEERPLEPEDLGFLLDTLKWEKSDPYLVIRIRHQQENAPQVLGHVLHSDLFRLFPLGYILYQDQQQTVILNLAREPLRVSEIRYRLAPLCRDYCLYAGISSPVAEIADLSQAVRQSDLALGRAFFTHGERWVIPFSDCALDYILGNLPPELAPRYLAATEWLTLLEHDRRKDTQYFETLRVYLLSERDIPKTARKLIIHRTTLLYRLKRILALTGLNLDDENLRLYLLLSLRLLEQHRLLSPPAGI